MSEPTTPMSSGPTQLLESGTRVALEDVTSYVACVRRALADLPPDEVDDLTGGMEADLAELLAERGGTLEGALGAPSTYAVELRQAAGLPDSPARAVRTRTLDLGAWWAAERAAWERTAARVPWLGAAASFIATLRPAWWVLRGYAVAWLLASKVGLVDRDSYLRLSWGLVVVGGTGVVASVALGLWTRRELRPQAAPEPTARHRWARVLLLAGNVVALLVVFVGAAPQIEYVNTGGYPQGLNIDGSSVGNLYLYDSQGHRLSGVRIFDDQGRPVDIGARVDPVTGVELPRPTDVFGQQMTNVYPEPYVSGGDPYGGDPAGNPSDPAYGGIPQWSPPPSVAPLASSATSSATSVPMASTSAVPTSSATAHAPASTATGTSTGAAKTSRPATS